MACRILHFTDTHLYADGAATLYGANPYRNLLAVVADVQARGLQADLLLCTGDLVHDETEAGYALLRASVAPLGLPTYCLPGNHDDTALLEQSWPGHCACSGLVQVRMGNWQILLLNSAVPGQVGGHLKAADLAALEGCLREERERFGFIALHHHPVEIGSPWLDTIGVDNGERLLAILNRHRNARGVLFGHVHQAFRATVDDAVLYATPSTCVQFRPGTETTEIDDAPPAYRHLTLHDDGGIETAVYWLER